MFQENSTEMIDCIFKICKIKTNIRKVAYTIFVISCYIVCKKRSKKDRKKIGAEIRGFN